MKKNFEKYKHALPLIVYMVVYLSWFCILEKAIRKPNTVIYMKLDDLIPFCEYFVIPYYLWFGYVSIVVLYLLFTNKQDYFRSCTFLFTGMTVFLIVSTLWPNGHHLRPAILPRDNFCSQLVAMMYKADTPTNLWPSIHVFNSIGAHIAVCKNSKLRKHKVLCIGSLVLCISIILSTVFIKQHSLFDLITGVIMAVILYVVVYHLDIVSVYQAHTHGKRKERRKFS